MNQDYIIEKIDKTNLFARNQNTIKREIDELRVQEKAQKIVKELLDACIQAGMGRVDPAQFGKSSLTEFAIIAARNSINVTAKYRKPEQNY